MRKEKNNIKQKKNSKLLKLTNIEVETINGGGFWERFVEEFGFDYLNYGIVIKNSNSR